jgi:hypothetical protein
VCAMIMLTAAALKKVEWMKGLVGWLGCCKVQ